MISAATLVKAGLTPVLADRFAVPFAAACSRFAINTPARVAGFFGQCWVESAGFTALQESLYYSTPDHILATFPREVGTLADAKLLVGNPEGLAQIVYSDREGNGNRSSGDGWRFIGRGLCDLTFRNNYAAASNALGRPYLAQPELLEQPSDAAMVAAWFWSVRGCNALADAQRWDGITRQWNGPGMEQAGERRTRSILALEAFA